MRRGQLIWGVILLLVGGLLLLDEMGFRFPGGMSPMDLLWPLILILAGAWILFGVFVRGRVETEQASIDLQGAREASLKINHGAGELTIHGGAGGGTLARGSFAGGLDHKASKNGDRLEVRMKPARDFVDFPFLGPHTRLDWDVALNGDVPLALTLEVGANKCVADLRDLQVTDLKLATGASDTKITLPARGRIRAELEVGAAALEVIVPEGVSARIRGSVGAGDLKVDETRFPHSAGVYQSPDFESAPNSADVNVSGGAASIRIR